MLACYTNVLSLRPGERFTLHASAAASPCALEIARVGAQRRIVLSLRDIAVGDHEVEPGAGSGGCGWPACAEIEIGGDWPSGYYDLRLTDAQGAQTRHFLCVKPPAGTAGARAALVLSTNTWQAYNWWGGANAYADVAALMERRVDLAGAMEGAIGVLSTQRPFVQMLLAPPADAPRLVNLRKRGFGERPFASDPTWPKRRERSPYDGAAGYLGKWEHAFAAWAEGESLRLDYFTDFDLDAEPGVLTGYRAVILAGHSEYWSAPQRRAIEAFVDGGGGLAIFSGNTCFWKVRWQDRGDTLVCQKWRGFSDDPVGAKSPRDATHLWSHPAFGAPEAAITGLSFLFGGYHRLGNCVARGQGGYTIYDEDHWALAGADLYFGDVVGAEIPLLGYENDGCRFHFGDDGRPVAEPILGVPANLEIIALAPAALGEQAGRGWPPLIPPERLEVIGAEVFGDDGAAARRRLLHGHAVMASFRRGAGEVFNGGTTEWAYGLAAADPFITAITRNVLRRFGAL